MVHRTPIRHIIIIISQKLFLLDKRIWLVDSPPANE